MLTHIMSRDRINQNMLKHISCERYMLSHVADPDWCVCPDYR